MISIEKSIYDPRSPNDGLRVLVMRYWPRGIRKDRVDVWLRDLGTSPKLIKAWKSGKLSWVDFKKAYLAELKAKSKRELVGDLAKRARREKVTLLCSCRDHTRCHRAILKQLVERAS